MGKLVRDKIPKIIKSEGREAPYLTLDLSGYKQAVLNKMEEEVKEVVNSYGTDNLIEELADLQEVIETLMRIEKIKPIDVKQVQLKKRKEKGGFRNRIYMAL